MFLKSLLIPYLITLSLEKVKYKNCLAKKSLEKNLNMLYAKICVNPALDLKAFFKIFEFFYMLSEKLVMLICHITVSLSIQM